MDRGSFLRTAGLGAATMALSANSLLGYNSIQNKKVRIGIIGGRFGLSFQFHEHPDCIVEGVSDLIPERVEALMKTYNCSKSYKSLEDLIKDPKIDAVFIATGAPDHARHVIASLHAGKHVLCAVPAAMTLEECHDILDAVKNTGLTYMMAETSIWRQSMITVKKLYADNTFGN